MTGSLSIGGLAGNNTGEIDKCYATGNITGLSNAGGIAGSNYTAGGKITSCVALNNRIRLNSTSASSIGRIVGAFDAGVLSGNRARKDMVFQIISVSTTNIETGTATNKNGENIATPFSSSIYTTRWWNFSTFLGGMGYSSTLWDIASGRLPRLKTAPDGGAFNQDQNPAI